MLTDPVWRRSHLRKEEVEFRFLLRFAPVYAQPLQLNVANIGHECTGASIDPCEMLRHQHVEAHGNLKSSRFANKQQQVRNYKIAFAFTIAKDEHAHLATACATTDTIFAAGRSPSAMPAHNDQSLLSVILEITLNFRTMGPMPYTESFWKHADYHSAP